MMDRYNSDIRQVDDPPDYNKASDVRLREINPTVTMIRQLKIPNALFFLGKRG